MKRNRNDDLIKYSGLIFIKRDPVKLAAEVEVGVWRTLTLTTHMIFICIIIR